MPGWVAKNVPRESSLELVSDLSACVGETDTDVSHPGSSRILEFAPVLLPPLSWWRPCHLLLPPFIATAVLLSPVASSLPFGPLCMPLPDAICLLKDSFALVPPWLRDLQ